MQQIANIPLYLDWTFWAVVIATLALVLSQIPPLYSLLRGGRLDIELYSRIHLSHKVGNPNIQLHLILTNPGGRNIKVKEIILMLKKDGKEITRLPAQSYLSNPADKTTVLFTSLLLKPKDEWAHIINFTNYFSREDDKKYRSAESSLKKNIVNLRMLPENKDKIVKVDESIIAPFVEMFKNKFIWKDGEYEILVSVITSKENVNLQEKYRFTLFETDSTELSKVKDDYNSGDGLFWDSGNHPGVIVPIVKT